MPQVSIFNFTSKLVESTNNDLFLPHTQYQYVGVTIISIYGIRKDKTLQKFSCPFVGKVDFVKSTVVQTILSHRISIDMCYQQNDLAFDINTELNKISSTNTRSKCIDAHITFSCQQRSTYNFISEACVSYSY